jgi:hypothetical protein
MGVTLCYVVALQAFLAAFGTARTVARTSPLDVALVICHSSDGVPSSDDTRSPQELPCVHCALASASAGLLPAPVPTAVALLSTAGRAERVVAGVATVRPPARAGPARAPPTPA